ncbi:hypothetical protein BRC2024_PQPTKSFJ_CDS_0233 [Tegunavirus sp. BRC001]
MSWFSDFLFGKNIRETVESAKSMTDPVDDKFPLNTWVKFEHIVEHTDDLVALRFNKLFARFENSTYEWKDRVFGRDTRVEVFACSPISQIELFSLQDETGSKFNLTLTLDLLGKPTNGEYRTVVSASIKRKPGNKSEHADVDGIRHISSVAEAIVFIEQLIHDGKIVLTSTPASRYKSYKFELGKHWKKDNIIVTCYSRSMTVHTLNDDGTVKVDNIATTHLTFNKESFYRDANNKLNEIGVRDETWVEVESPESEWPEAFIATKAKEISERFKELSEHMDHVFAMHKRIADAMQSYEVGYIAPIKCFDSYTAFLNIAKMKSDFEDYEVENYLRSIGKFERG